MNWISVKDKLPVYDNEPTYNWVIVSSKDLRWTIGRYGHKNVDGKLIPCWEFYDSNDDITQCCYAGDSLNSLSIDEIEYWMEIDRTPYEIKINIENECKTYGHSFTWMPQDGRACMRCGFYETDYKGKS